MNVLQNPKAAIPVGPHGTETREPGLYPGFWASCPGFFLWLCSHLSSQNGFCTPLSLTGVTAPVPALQGSQVPCFSVCLYCCSFSAAGSGWGWDVREVEVTT